MDRNKLVDLYKKYDLTKDDVYKHQHYVIITRTGIDKIQAVEQIAIDYEVIRCEPNYSVFKAIAVKEGKSIQTFVSPFKADPNVCIDFPSFTAMALNTE